MSVNYRRYIDSTLEPDQILRLTKSEFEQLTAIRSSLWQSISCACYSVFLGALFTFLNSYTNQGELWIQFLSISLAAFTFGVAVISSYLWYKVIVKKNELTALILSRLSSEVI